MFDVAIPWWSFMVRTLVVYPSPSGLEAWSGVLTAVDGIVPLNADQVAAAKGGDAEGFVQATTSLGDIQIELEDATEAAWVAACADVHA